MTTIRRGAPGWSAIVAAHGETRAELFDYAEVIGDKIELRLDGGGTEVTFVEGDFQATPGMSLRELRDAWGRKA